MKRILVYSIAVFVLFAQSLHAQQKVQDKVQKIEADSAAQVSIKLYDKTMYYPAHAQNNPILVHVSIVNKGQHTFRFKLADDRAFSLDFTAFNARNIKLTQTDNLVRKRTTSQTVYFRELSLDPEEEYAFIVNLKDYLDIVQPAIYYFELTFYPELYKSKYNALVSNRLSLEVNPDPGIGASTLLPVNYDTGVILKPEAIAPDKVIEQTIIARQKSLWDQFFLYMDVESIYTKNEINKRKYAAASEQERITMLSSFKKNMAAAHIDSDIAAIPEFFSIEKTAYTKNEGTVIVLEWFKYPTFKEKKRYTYFVRLRDGIWQIYDYTVDNLGTE
ncbi:hypothetical protein V1L52_06880 [Treponema sp. HNW]|uniref:hypothetical protein n=1 Tax=Treponema sp. HNW TaxID=3116654 RepID=UPI003D0AC60B